MAATTESARTDGRYNTRRSTETIAPQATGGAPRKESEENATIPQRLQRMSSRYASSASNVLNTRATSCAIDVMIAAVARKITVSTTQIGSPLGCMPKYSKSFPDLSIVTGKTRTKVM